MPIIIMVIVLAGMMFWTQRQQRRQQQAHKEQLAALTKGDEVVTIGGLYALVDEVNQSNQTIVLDAEGVYLTFELTAIRRVVTRAGADGLLTKSETTANSDQVLEETPVVEPVAETSQSDL